MFGGRVQETEGGVPDGSDPGDGAAADILFPAEGGKGRHHLHVIVDAEDISILILGESIHVTVSWKV